MTKTHSIVGVWRVKSEGAPYPYHMFVFHADGTMQQSNPPAGNSDTSDTAGMGVWAEENGQIMARFEEFRLDYKDQTTTRGVVDFRLKVENDSLTGECDFNIFSVEGDSHLKGPLKATIEGQRVTLN